MAPLKSSAHVPSGDEADVIVSLPRPLKHLLKSLAAVLFAPVMLAVVFVFRLEIPDVIFMVASSVAGVLIVASVAGLFKAIFATSQVQLSQGELFFVQGPLPLLHRTFTIDVQDVDAIVTRTDASITSDEHGRRSTNHRHSVVVRHRSGKETAVFSHLDNRSQGDHVVNAVREAIASFKAK